MSHNVDHVECLSGSLTISKEGIEWVRRDELELDGPDAYLPESTPEISGDGVTVKMFWSGECSGNAVKCGALEKFFSFTKGTAEFVFYWEGGNSATGYRVVDGVMTEHDVSVSLNKDEPESSVSDTDIRIDAGMALESINQCLSMLGIETYTSLDQAVHKLDRWVAFAEQWSKDEEARPTWTEAMLRVIGQAPNLTPRGRSDYAVEAADAVTKAQMQRFPPRMPKTEQDPVSDTDLAAIERDYWLPVMQDFGISSPTELRSVLERDKKRRQTITTTGEVITSLQRKILDLAKELQDIRKSSLIPLEKPERLEAGQRWALVLTCEKSFDEGLHGRFSGCDKRAWLFGRDDEEAMYLGKP